MIRPIQSATSLKSFASSRSFQPNVQFRQYRCSGILRGDFFLRYAGARHARYIKDNLAEFIMRPSHPVYEKIDAILFKAGEQFRRLSVGESARINTDNIEKNLSEIGIVKIHPRVYELGNIGWISKSHVYLPGDEFDFCHLNRALHSKRCRKINDQHHLSIKIPIKYLFPAPLHGLKAWIYPETYFLVYKKINLMEEEDFKNLLLSSDERLREVAEKIAKFVRLTSYCNIHQKNFRFTNEGELALIDTEPRHFRSHSYPNGINFVAHRILDYMSSRKVEDSSENVFFYPPAREVFLKHANEVKALLNQHELNVLEGPSSNYYNTFGS